MRKNRLLKCIIGIACIVLAAEFIVIPAIRKNKEEFKTEEQPQKEQGTAAGSGVDTSGSEEEYSEYDPGSGMPENVWDRLPGFYSSPLYQELKDTDSVALIFEKKGLEEQSEFILEDLAVDRSIRITLTGLTGRHYTGRIYRIRGNEFWDRPLPAPVPESEPSLTSAAAPNSGTSLTPEITPAEAKTQPTGSDPVISDAAGDPVISVFLEKPQQEASEVLQLELDRTYAYELKEDENYFVLLLRRPKEIYPKIIVVDAGHGGKDFGTYSKDYKYWEKDMNLSILLELKYLLDAQEDIRVYYTRTEDRRLTLNQRVDLANDVEADFFLSIHCNSNPSSLVHGTEVLFNELQDEWEDFNSREFALLCAKEVSDRFGLKNRGIIPRSSNVHIIGEARMPVALVEMAYMTNSGDLEALIRKDRQQQAAAGLYHAILKAYERTGGK